MMKRSMFLGVLFAIVLWPTLAAAQDQSQKSAKNAISIDVLQPIWSPVDLLIERMLIRIPLNVQYQRVLSDHFVLLIKAGLDYSWVPANAPQDSPGILYYGIDGWGLSVNSAVGVDLHPFHKGLNGLHVGLSGIFSYGTGYRDGVLTKGTAYEYTAGLGLAVGWQFLLPANIIIDLTLGVGYVYLGRADVFGATGSMSTFIVRPPGIFLGFRF